MQDDLTIERIKTLHPSIRQEVLEMYLHVNNNLLGKGVRLRFSQVLRTFAEQDYLYSKGRTISGPRVTNAKGGSSYHNYGLAFDIVMLYDKNGDGIFETASWDTLFDGDGDGVSDWLEVTRYFELKGYSNGFLRNGKKWDKPHFQKTFGYSWRNLLTKYTKKDFISGTNYVTL